MASKTMTAPLAIIKINGIAIGKMKTIRITESISRTPVRGIGELAAQELPPTSWDGTLNCSSYLVDFSKALNVLEKGEIIQRKVLTVDDFINTVLLQEQGVQIDIMRKVKVSVDPTTGVPTTALQVFASIKGCFITRESMDISEGQIGGRDADFSYTTPVIYN